MVELNPMQEGRCRECKECITDEDIIWKYASGTKMISQTLSKISTGYNCPCGYTENW
tara:strand:+ start:162 stop:332 length:171 start_codon:yes stop_codon:yes gene_type:complete